MVEANAANEIPTPEPTVPKHTDSKGRKIVPRREFDEAFKRAAVVRAKKWKGQMTVLAKEMDIHPTMLRRWMTGDLGNKVKAKATKLKGVRQLPSGMRLYSDDFKRKAVERWNKGKETGEAISKDLKISSSMLSAWRIKLSPESTKKRPKHTLSPKANPTVSKYPLEFKQAVLMRVAKGERITDVAKEIGTSVSGIDYWRRTIGGKRKYMKGRGLATANALGVPFDAGGAKMPAPLTIGTRDAISFLKHAKDEAHSLLHKGLIKEFDQAHLLAMMALNSLTK
jgi:transposase-like protein